MGASQLLTARSRLDIFPATVVHPVHGTLGRTRVFVEDGRVRVYGENGARVEFLFETTALDLQQVGRLYTFTDEFGEFTVKRQGSCGCGSPLKKMPWPS